MGVILTDYFFIICDNERVSFIYDRENDLALDPLNHSHWVGNVPDCKLEDIILALEETLNEC